MAAVPPVVVHTKLAPPRLREDFVRRTDLVDLLVESKCRLTVISGAAGMGKSTLMAQAYDVGAGSAWFSVDQADNDPTVLWWGLISCLGERFDDFGLAYRHRLAGGGAGLVDDVVAFVVNELGAIGEPVHLFIDDVDGIQDMTCRRSLHRFVRGLPAGCRVTVASRGEPPLPLARFRVEDDLLEVTGSDLAMSGREASQLLAGVRPDLDDEIVQRLTAHTEGWPAGLHLAGMALADTGNQDTFILDLQGTDQLIAEYLLSEVVATLPVEQQQFLTATAPLQRMCGELCDAVTGAVGSAKVLEDLVRRNAFVIPLDRTGTWFRYHHMFGELLIRELQRSDPGRIRNVHLAAFEWLRDHQYLTEALDHGIAAGHIDAAADMLAAHHFALFNTGRLQTLLLLLERFDDDQICAHQPLAIAAAFGHTFAGNHGRARRYLEAAERASYPGSPPDGAVSMAASLALARSCLALDGIDSALADAHYVHEAEPPSSPWRDLASLVIGLAEMMRGNPEAAVPYLHEARESPNMAVAAYGLAELAVASHQRGADETALAQATEALERLTEHGLEDTIPSATANGVKALVNVGLGDRLEALDALHAGAQPMRIIGLAMPMDTMQAALLLAEAGLELDEPAQARDYLNLAGHIAAEVTDTGTMGRRLGRLRKRWDQLETGATDFDDTDTRPLTVREIEILALLPEGLTTRQIADELFLSKNTIKTYLRRLYRKLGVSSRSEAVARAGELGLAGDARPPGSHRP